MKDQSQQSPQPKPLVQSSGTLTPASQIGNAGTALASGSTNPLQSTMPAGNSTPTTSGTDNSGYAPNDSRNPNFNQLTGVYTPPSSSAPAAPSNPLSNQWGTVTNTVAPSGQAQTQLNTGNVPSLVGGGDLAGTFQQAQQAAYQNATASLDPQWQNQQTALQNQLADQGVMQNSEAWNKAMDDFQRQKQYAYSQAQNNAYQQGLAAQGQLYNQGLQSNQNAFGQALSAGNFANAGQAQNYGQNLSNAQLTNSAQNQIANQGLTASQIAEQLQAAQTQAGATVGAASLSANASMQNLQAQLAQQAQQNQFNNSLATRNQAINELLLQQQNPLQTINSLTSGSSVQSPNFTSTPGTNVGSTDIMQAIQNAYQGQLTGYNAQTGAANSNNAAMASIIAALICDRRLKKNIRKIGVLPSGCALYEFEYVWGEKGIGPMADEVERVKPEAVFTLRTGHKVVNFARL